MAKPSKADMIPEFYQGEEDIPSRLINYGDTITRQTNIAAYFLTKAFTRSELVIAENAVNVLESLVIKQTKDGQYQASLKNLNKNIIQQWSSLSHRDKKLLFTHYKRQFIFSKFRLLADLMARAGLSYIQDISVSIGEPEKKRKYTKRKKKPEAPILDPAI